MKSKLKIFQRFLILAVLCVGFGFILSTDKQNASAAPMYECCENCPGGGDPAMSYTYCYDQCNGEQYCTQECQANVDACYYSCRLCNLGCGFDCPVGGGCYIDPHCSAGWRCQGRSCYLQSRQCYVNSHCAAGQYCYEGLCYDF